MAQIENSEVELSSECDEAHSTYSSFREKIVEHTFISEVLRRLWARGIRNVDVLRSDVDGSGFDVVIKAGAITRYIQLKSMAIGGKAARWKVSKDLAACLGGCVVVVALNPATLAIGPFLWFGSKHGAPLPSIDHFPTAKHTKANSEGVKLERKNHREVPRSQFEEVDMDTLVGLLFDPAPEDRDVGASSYSPLNLQGALVKDGYPFVVISWDAEFGGLSALCYPGSRTFEIDGKSTDYKTIFIDMAHRVGSSINDVMAGQPFVMDLKRIPDPLNALQFLDLCNLYRIAVLPLTKYVPMIDG